MLNKTQSTLHFAIGKSRYRLQMLVVLHGLSLLSCWFNDLPFHYQLTASVLVVVSAWIQRRAYETSGFFLRYTAHEGWAIAYDATSYKAIRVKPSTVVSHWLTVLYFEMDQSNKAAVIFSDAMGAGDYRRLTVSLKILECDHG